MGIFDRLSEKNNKREEEMFQQKSSDVLRAIRHVVFALTSDVVEEYKKSNVTPLDIVAVFMGKAEGSMEDVKIDQERIYPSDKLRAKLFSWSVWLTKSGALIVTQPATGEKEWDMLEGATYLGSVPYLQYMTVVCLKLGLDPDNIVVSELKGISEPDSIYVLPTSRGTTRVCGGCGRRISGETPKLVSLRSNEVLIKPFCSQNCATPIVKSFIDRSVCVWCGKKADSRSWKLGGFGEPYCCEDCYSAAGKAMFWFEFHQKLKI